MLSAYSRALASAPIRTKVISSTVLATASDLTAQACEGKKKPWDHRRTFGLAVFGAGYMACFQHYLFQGKAEGGIGALSFVNTPFRSCSGCCLHLTQPFCPAMPWRLSTQGMPAIGPCLAFRRLFACDQQSRQPPFICWRPTHWSTSRASSCAMASLEEASLSLKCGPPSQRTFGPDIEWAGSFGRRSCSSSFSGSRFACRCSGSTAYPTCGPR